MIKKIKNKWASISKSVSFLQDMEKHNQNDSKNIKVNLGQIQSHLNNQKQSINNLSEVEFQVFSQFGDDGIIQYLINKIDIPNKIFIEFGMENYKEANTRFLLINNKWSGYVIDGAQENINYVKNDFLYYLCDLHAKAAFIDKDNINSLIKEFLDKGYPSEIGILSIDIDGNDYWVWDAINVVNPVIIIAEYNAVYGYQKPWTIPYKADFFRLDSDPTSTYWGVSLAALCFLGDKKGYDFIGTNSNGNNAYFVRKDKRGSFKKLTAAEGYNKASFRETMGKNNEVISIRERLNTIKDMLMYNVQENVVEKIETILSSK